MQRAEMEEEIFCLGASFSFFSVEYLMDRLIFVEKKVSNACDLGMGIWNFFVDRIESILSRILKSFCLKPKPERHIAVKWNKMQYLGVL
jgi:hypothetical protein